MKSKNEEDEDIISGDFKKVPIERSQYGGVEVYNIYSGISYSKERLKRKIFRYSLTVILVIVFLIITKTLLWDGIVELFSEEGNSYDNYDSNYNDSFGDVGSYDNSLETFYLEQNISEINMESFSSPQLRNPQNIRLVNKLEMTLCVEYDKFVHMKIKDAENPRWEVPDKGILNEDYLSAVENNRISLSIYSRYLDSKTFYVEFLSNKYSDEQDFDHFRDIDMIKEEKLDHLEEFSFRLMTNEENQFYLFNSSENFIFSDNYINFQSLLTTDKIYGFGERNHEFKLNKGLYTIWPQDLAGAKPDMEIGGGNLYGHHPVGIHKTMFDDLWLGFVFMNTNDQDVKISTRNETGSEYNLEHKTIGGIIDYYIIVDNSPEEVLKNIQFLLGIPSLPPFWSLGNHQSRYGYKDFDEFKNVYELYKKYEIPIDTMWVDIDSMKDYEIFTVNKNFSKLGNYVKDEIHKDGGKFVPIVDLGLTCENPNSNMLRLGKSLNVFIKSNYTKKPLIGKVWGGKTVFPDFMNPNISKFWNTGLNIYQTQVNFDGIWLDMNEPATLLSKDEKCLTEIAEESDCTKDKNMYHMDNLAYIPGYYNSMVTLSSKSISENALMNDTFTIYDAKPLISYFEGETTFNYLYNDLKVRPFILSRSTTLGSGKYVFHWLGDNYSREEDIKSSISGIFNFNIFGIPFTGADICGFYNNANKELCLRWYNLGSFYPFMRNHDQKKSVDQFPWSFDDENAIKSIKNTINYRYSLLRYMYSQLFLISLNEKGSFFKPIMFEFPEDDYSYEDIESKIMIGEAALLCAFHEINEKDKEFLLPNATFNKYPNGKSIMNQEDKNNKIVLSGKLDEIHLFLREGFIVPKQNTFDKYIMNTMKLREEKLDLIINIDSNKQSVGDIFFDNDERDTIKEKKYYRVSLNFLNDKLEIHTDSNNLAKYNYNDHILGNIELWNINTILDTKLEENKNKKYSFEINYLSDLNKEKDIIDGNLDIDNNKLVFDVSKNNKIVSLFNVEKILFDL